MLDAPARWWRLRSLIEEVAAQVHESTRKVERTQRALQTTSRPEPTALARVTREHEGWRAEVIAANSRFEAAKQRVTTIERELRRAMAELELLYDKRFGGGDEPDSVAAVASAGARQFNAFVGSYQSGAKRFVKGRNLGRLKQSLRSVANSDREWDAKTATVARKSTEWLSKREQAWDGVVRDPWYRMASEAARTYSLTLDAPRQTSPSYEYCNALAEAEGRMSLIGTSAAKGAARGGFFSAITGGADLGISAALGGLVKGATAAYKAGSGRLEEGLVNAALATVRRAESEMVTADHAAAMSAVQTARSEIAAASREAARALASRLDREVETLRQARWNHEDSHTEALAKQATAKDALDTAQAAERRARQQAEPLRHQQADWDRAATAHRATVAELDAAREHHGSLLSELELAKRWTMGLGAAAVTAFAGLLAII